MGTISDWFRDLGQYESDIGDAFGAAARGLGTITPVARDIMGKAIDATEWTNPDISIGLGRSTTPGDRNAAFGLPWHLNAPTPDTVSTPDHLGQAGVSRFSVGGQGGPRGSRRGGSGGPPSVTYNTNDNILAQLEQQRAAMLERRNLAISAAGRGAGAPYNAAIARLNDEIAKAQDLLGKQGPYWDNKRDVNAHVYGIAQEEAAVSADEAQGQAKDLHEETLNNVSSAYSDAQLRTTSVLDRIGADAATRMAAAEEVGRLEDTIYEMEEVSARDSANVMQASEDLAVAMAKASGATNNLELVRSQIMIESDIKENINNMLADRKQQTSARNAAVSAARDMAAARFPADMPLNREGWASLATNEAVNKVMGGKPQRDQDAMHEVLSMFSYTGVSTNDARKILRERDWSDPSETTIAVLGKYGFQPDTFAGLPSSTLTSLSRNIVTTMNTYEHSLRYYDENFANADPDSFQPGTVGALLSRAEQLRQTGMVEDDVRHVAIDVENDAERGKDTSAFDSIIGWN